MPMSAEERDLLELQTQLLEQAQEASNSGNALNELLMPILLQESGYEVEYGTKQVGNPAYNKTKRQLKRWEEYVGSKKGLELGSKEVKAAVRRVEELKAKLADIPKTIDQRAVVGLTRADDPARDMREENEQLLLERQNAALRGELPVSPALLSDLDQQGKIFAPL
jgi:beta-glucosidase-like glycosyl hydrolase